MSDVHGLHAVAAVLEQAPDRVRALYVQKAKGRDTRRQALVDQARAHGVRVDFVERSWLDRRVDGNHQGVAADCHDVALHTEQALEAAWEDFSEPRLLLVLDGVQDPRNLGACLRSARAAGVEIVLLPKRRSAPVNAAALKTAAGAAEQLYIVEVTNLARRLKWLQNQGVWLVGTAGQAPQAYFEADYRGHTALVMGGEEKGLRRLTREYCDELVGIPMSGGVESLNVSVAAGIVLFEAVRQRAAAHSSAGSGTDVRP